VRSWPFRVSPLIPTLRRLDAGELKACVYAHEQQMMREASGPLMSAALRLIATSAVDLDALESAAARETTPWLLTSRGFLFAPEVELAGAAS
jgi:hypothetical protein